MQYDGRKITTMGRGRPNVGHGWNTWSATASRTHRRSPGGLTNRLHAGIMQHEQGTGIQKAVACGPAKPRPGRKVLTEKTEDDCPAEFGIQS